MVNDQQSHEAGDKRIIEVADELNELPDMFEICRIGGDEFLLIADKNFNINLLQLITDVSYGCYRKAENESVSYAMKKADSLMYTQKNAKKKYNKLFNI